MTNRDLRPETVEEYFSAGVEAAFPLSETIEASLEIDPHHQELRLIAPAVGSTPDLATYERITVERLNLVNREGDWFRLTVDATRMHFEAYVLIISIVDQLESGASFRHAVSESLSGLRGLLTSRKRLSAEKEAGLIGELLVLAHALDSRGEEYAMGAWLGPQAEEHDFGFDLYDAEVKTTRSEARVHVIGSETQLQRTPDRALYLVSIQLTAAGQAGQAITLPALIASTRDKLEKSRRTFDLALEAVGWSAMDSDLYPDRYQLRSAPRGYIVDDTFPAITSPRLDEVIPQRALVSAVSYRIDVTHLPIVALPDPLSGFCEVPA